MPSEIPVKHILYQDSLFRRLLRFIVNPDLYMTYRFPFQKAVRITYPKYITDINNPECVNIIKHEMIHAEIFYKWWGPPVMIFLDILFPLPVLFSGRWFIERRAYLHDIHNGYRTVDSSVDALCKYYFFPWPKSKMRSWLNNNLKDYEKIFSSTIF